jgi:Arc/MetJ-type ribon-helix-helix transcriptional regulator
MVEDTITITVAGKEDVEWIRSKVQSGSFASEAEVVAQSIALSREEDAELDSWMRAVVANRYDRHKANPQAGLSFEQVMQHVEERRARRAAQSR